MAVQVLAFPSLTQGEMELVRVRCQSSDLIQSGEMDRILKSLTFIFRGSSISSLIPELGMRNTSSISCKPILQQCPDQEDRSLDYFSCPSSHRIFGSRNSEVELEEDEEILNACANIHNRIEFFGQAWEFCDDGENSCLCQAPISYPDGGHRCPYFPCPICHRNDR